MYNLHSLPYLGVLLMAAAANNLLDKCISSNPKYTMNVVLLEDNNYEWSLQFVKPAVEQAIEKDRQENINHGMAFQVLHMYSIEKIIIKYNTHPYVLQQINKDLNIEYRQIMIITNWNGPQTLPPRWSQCEFDQVNKW